jgi:inhibitor of KinA
LDKNKIPRPRPLGDTAVTYEYGPSIDRDLSRHVTALAQSLVAKAVPGLHDVVPTFRSLTVHFDPDAISATALTEIVTGLRAEPADAQAAADIDIPVLYGGEYGPDLRDVAEAAGLSEADAAALHASEPYHVYMLGFLPGFAYLGDLPQALRMPRLDVPRTRVPRGSVAVADEMTAVYPSASPGGWRLIGRTPLRLFDATQDPPCPLRAGDRVQFRPIDADEFEHLSQQAGTQ